MPYRSNISSALTETLISPEFSSTLTHLHLHHKNLLLTHFPSQYLLPPTSSPGTDLTIATLLRSARQRGLGDQLALQGADGIEVLEAWGSKHGKGAAVEVLVRKAQGGASKGMARSIELIEPVKSDDYTPTSTLVVRPLPALQSKQSQPTGTGQSQDKTPHLDLPFNLSLTDAQRQARADVPVPYAHAGDEDGASKVAGAGIWWEADEGDGLDDEEEEI
jgi:elongator complex protein 5